MRKEHEWSLTDEKRFIDGLGTFALAHTIARGWHYVDWLEQYVRVNQGRKGDRWKQAVEYAKRKINRLRHSRTYERWRVLWGMPTEERCAEGFIYHCSTCESFGNCMETLEICQNCSHAIAGVCFFCDGDNYGHETEVSPRGCCKNWSHYAAEVNRN